MGRHHFPPAQFIGIGTRQVWLLSSDPSTATLRILAISIFYFRIRGKSNKKKAQWRYRRRCGFDETLLLGRLSSSPPKQSLDGPPGHGAAPLVHWPVLLT